MSRGKKNENLSEREMEVLKLLAKGKSNTEIAKDLIVSVHTAKIHALHICDKLLVKNRLLAVITALKMGLISIEDITNKEE